MKSYSEQLATFKRLALNNSDDAVAFFNEQNDATTRARLGQKDWLFMQKERTVATTASSRTVQIPADCEQLRSVRVLSGTISYTPTEVTDVQTWARVTMTNFTSDIPTHFRVINNTIELNPIPASTNPIVYFNYKMRVPNATTADYTTGTVSITSGSTSVTGSGTTFTSSMVGRYIKTTDGMWYEIAAYTSSTVITLSKPYLGASVSGGAYKIGVLSPFPDGYENLPIFDTLSLYYDTQKNDSARAASFLARAERLSKAMEAQWQNYSTNVVIDEGRHRPTINPNLTVML